jgi:phage terminase large subunit GpA-like protein
MRTDDLFLAAFALSRGGELVGIDVERANGRRVAVFAIDGPGVEDAERDYFRGTTTVDVQHLKVQVRRLKDRIFDALRADERGAHAKAR